VRLSALVVVLVCFAPGAVATAAPQTCHFTYGGGPVIPNVKVVQIFWGATNNPQYAYKIGSPRITPRSPTAPISIG